MAAIVEAKSVVKTYQGKVAVPALNGVDLTVEQGEMVAIMGPSGCGKTTLLELPLGPGLLRLRRRADRRRVPRGHVRPGPHRPPGPAHGIRVPVLQPDPCPHRGRERRAAAARQRRGVQGGPRPRARTRWRWSASRTEPATVPEELSGGERQRVTIARSLVNEPALVWADEPTGDLDSEKAAEVVALMRSLNVERGLTFVIVTHDIAVGRATDRIVRMLDGRVVDELLPEVTDVRPHHAA